MRRLLLLAARRRRPQVPAARRRAPITCAACAGRVESGAVGRRGRWYCSPECALAA